MASMQPIFLTSAARLHSHPITLMEARTMHLGLYLAPQTGGEQEDVANIDAVVDQAVEADAAGFSTIYLTEHHLDDYNTYCDPYLLGAYLAGNLQRAWLATSV